MGQEIVSVWRKLGHLYSIQLIIYRYMGCSLVGLPYKEPESRI